MSRDRRRSARVAILGRLHGLAVSLDVPVKVNDLSLGGMAIETPVAFPIGAIQEFALTLGDESSVTLSGRVVRCQNVSGPDEPPVYVTGLQFIDEDEPAESPEAGQIMGRLE